VRPARVSSAVLVAAAVTAVSWFALDLWTRQGGRLPPLPWFTAVAIAVVGAVVAVLGWEVRRSVRGERSTPVDPLAAARVVVLAKAAVYGGAVLVGWYAAQALVLIPDVSVTHGQRLLAAGATALAAAVLAGAGLLAQRWCRLPPDDEGGGPGWPDEDEALSPPPQRSPQD
jgi:polyferredoxin